MVEYSDRSSRKIKPQIAHCDYQGEGSQDEKVNVSKWQCMCLWCVVGVGMMMVRRRCPEENPAISIYSHSACGHTLEDADGDPY